MASKTKGKAPRGTNRLMKKRKCATELRVLPTPGWKKSSPGHRESYLMHKLDREIVEAVISEAIGEDVLPLIKAFRKKEEQAELELAEKLGIEVNSLRNMLYRLHQHNLVRSERRRDPENGWHIYWWTFQSYGFDHLFTLLTTKNILALQKRLDKESSGSFYQCTSRCARLEFDEAFGMDFRCPECGSLMNLTEKDPKHIKVLQEQIAELKALTDKPR